MNYFGRSPEELLAAVNASKNHAEVAAWFGPCNGPDDQKNENWNAFSVNLGKPGHPMRETLAWAKKKYNAPGDDPGMGGVFKLIEWDEGWIPR